MKLLKHIWETLKRAWYEFLYSIQLYISRWREQKSDFERKQREIDERLYQIIESINEGSHVEDIL